MATRLEISLMQQYMLDCAVVHYGVSQGESNFELFLAKTKRVWRRRNKNKAEALACVAVDLHHLCRNKSDVQSPSSLGRVAMGWPHLYIIV
eukprot:705931-Pleurochrysis_carterae.AAC.1